METSDALKLIEKYYPKDSEASRYYHVHANAVAKATQLIVENNPHLKVDIEKVKIMALLHDIGIFLTNAPAIGCYGTFPYLAHGYLGRELLEKEGLNDIAPVCERHVGVGLSLFDIEKNKLPLPHRDMQPQTIEEKIVCYADKFFSKSSPHPELPKPIDKIIHDLSKYGDDKIKKFLEMENMFGSHYIYENFR